MDARKALAAGTVLDFPGMCCTIEEEIGRGSNAIVYRGFYPDLLNREEKHLVLIKELFPFHPEAAIYRKDDLEIVCLPEGRETYEIHRQSFAYGNKIHLKMLEKHPDLLGANINTFSRNQTEYSILGYTGGRSLEVESEGALPKLAVTARRMLGLLDALEAFHESGFLHLDIAPDNILLVGEGAKERVVLIDYNSVYDMRMPEQEAPAYYSIKQGYTAPEIRSGKLSAICPASDLYSVAAVFYRCLSGASLTPFQMIRPTPPDVSGCACLSDMPDTVVSMVKQILYTGLQNLPSRRYRTVAQMREAVRELVDRIEGVGITHWALWEAGKKTVQNIIRDNPSLSYLNQSETMFPTDVEAGEERITLQEFMERAARTGGQHTVLTAAAGMGKTTALLRTVTEQSSRYSSAKPAIAYVSLYGWKEGRATYILDRILENLHYGRETETFENARQTLRRLLEEPIPTKNGDVPKLLLFLDGLNEASGSTQALTDEILSLASLAGVRMVITSRSDLLTLPFARASLMPLTPENVRDILSERGLLVPETEEVRLLLQTPLMLSMFIRSAEAEQKQIMVTSRDELLDAYFDALRRKEFADLPEDADMRWQIDAAVDFVLPELARSMWKKSDALDDGEMLKTVTDCYRLFSSRLLKRAFPRWIGHTKAIRGDAKTAEEWYGAVIHDVLWKRLGLLIRNDRGEYQIVHQVIGEYLIRKNEKTHRLIKRRQGFRIGLLAAAVILLLTGGTVFALKAEAEPPEPQAHPELLADRVLEYGLTVYQQFDRQVVQMLDLIETAEKRPAWYQTRLEFYRQSVKYEYPSADDVSAALNEMLADGEVMPWSGKPLNTEVYTELFERTRQYAEEYSELVDALTYVVQDENAAARFGDYVGQLKDLISTDAEIVALLYQVSCREHMEARYSGDDSALAQNYYAVTGELAELNAYFRRGEDEENIVSYLREELYNRRKTQKQKIVTSGILGMILPAPVEMATEDWNDCLLASDRMYGDMLWAISYIERFIEEPTWGNLQIARTALSAAEENADSISLRQPQMESKDYANLLWRGYDIAVVREDRELFEEARRKVRSDCLVLKKGLYEDVFWRDTCNEFGASAKLIQKHYTKELECLNITTEYLLLSIDDERQTDKCRSFAKQNCPALTACRTVAFEDANQARAARVETLDRIKEILLESSYHTARESRTAEDRYRTAALEGDLNVLRENAADFADMPSCLPYPQWDVVNDAEYGYYFFVDETNSRCPDERERLEREPDGCIIRFERIGKEEFLSYEALLSSLTLEPLLTVNEIDRYSLVYSTEDSGVVFTWTPEDVTFSVTDIGSVCFVPLWYALSIGI